MTVNLLGDNRPRETAGNWSSRLGRRENAVQQIAVGESEEAVCDLQRWSKTYTGRMQDPPWEERWLDRLQRDESSSVDDSSGTIVLLA
jgi:hypothetical protein